MNVTFIGIGAIGLPMALQIQKAGYAVTGVDVHEAGVTQARASGLNAVVGYHNAPKGDVVIVMVATPEQLSSLVTAVGAAAHGQLWVIMSTVGPDSVREQGTTLRALGARVVDSPVSGGTARARTGELIIFSSGYAEDLETALPILRSMGNPRVTGERLGDGQSIKVVNQHLCSVHIAAAAEALHLATSLGLDPGVVLSLVEKGAAGSWMLSDRGPRMLKGTDVEVTSTINIFVKDSGMVAASGELCGAELPLLRIAHERFCQAADAGLGLRDDSRVIETWG